MTYASCEADYEGGKKLKQCHKIVNLVLKHLCKEDE